MSVQKEMRSHWFYHTNIYMYKHFTCIKQMFDISLLEEAGKAVIIVVYDTDYPLACMARRN